MLCDIYDLLELAIKHIFVLIKEIKMARVELSCVEDFHLTAINKGEENRVTYEIQGVYLMVRIVETIKFNRVRSVINVEKLD